MDVRGARWRKSSRSDNGIDASCVEVAFVETGTAGRDSKNPDGPVLHVPAGPWKSFLVSL